jgi:hypothetical protein
MAQRAEYGLHRHGERKTSDFNKQLAANPHCVFLALFEWFLLIDAYRRFFARHGLAISQVGDGDVQAGENIGVFLTGSY